MSATSELEMTCLGLLVLLSIAMADSSEKNNAQAIDFVDTCELGLRKLKRLSISSNVAHHLKGRNPAHLIYRRCKFMKTDMKGSSPRKESKGKAKRKPTK